MMAVVIAIRPQSSGHRCHMPKRSTYLMGLGVPTKGPTDMGLEEDTDKS